MEDQCTIRCNFGASEEVYDGCLNGECQDIDTTERIVNDLCTAKENIVISRCNRCSFTKSWRRKVDCSLIHKLTRASYKPMRLRAVQPRAEAQRCLYLYSSDS